MARLDDDEKSYATTDIPGLDRRMAIVSESGLYALVFSSRKPEARAFRRWVTGAVLPEIRRTGSYDGSGARLRIEEGDVRIDARDYGVHVILVTPTLKTVRRVEFDRILDERDALESEILACSLISAESMLDIMEQEASLSPGRQSGHAREWLEKTVRQGAKIGRQYLSYAWKTKHERLEQ